MSMISASSVGGDAGARGTTVAVPVASFDKGKYRSSKSARSQMITLRPTGSQKRQPLKSDG
jgi:hypothetical protein